MALIVGIDEAGYGPILGPLVVFKKNIAVINIRDLAKFDKGSLVDTDALVQAGLVKGKRDGVKLLGNGEIKYSLDVKVNQISKSAREKIEAAGGKVEVL